MRTRQISARSVCLALDTASFVAGWWAASMIILFVLSFLAPDNPWGSLAFAIMYGFVGAAGTLALYEAKSGNTFGRLMTGLVVVGPNGERLSRSRAAARALTKLAALGWLVYVGLEIEEHVGSIMSLLAPFAGYLVVNTALCLARRDGRGIIDVLVDSRSTAA